MMDLNGWLIFATVILVASISPGPNVVAVIVNTIDSGLRGAILTIVGNLLALFLIALAAAVGVGALLHAAPGLFTVMKITGGLYLLWMGAKILRNSFGDTQNLDIVADQPFKATSSELVFKAMLISFSNPKSIIFLSAVFPTFLDNSTPVPIQFATMFITIIGIVTIIHGTYGLLALRIKAGFLGINARKVFSRLSGFSFLGFGIGFVYDAQR